MIEVLDNFGNISGLRLNQRKCQSLRIGSLITSDITYLRNKKFAWSSNEAKALGIIFKTNRDHVLSLNLDPKINDFDVCLKQWQHRKLTLMGKIVVIKKLCAPETYISPYMFTKSSKRNYSVYPKVNVQFYMG